jgi:hypothetical protein
MVEVNGYEIRARIVHKGGGKFRIEEDPGGNYEGTVVDASDVISCNADKMQAENNSA